MTAALDQIASCLAGYDPDSMPVPLARDFIARLLPPAIGTETVALREALSRVLAEDLVSGLNVPAHDNSAMDGYALRGSDLQREGPTRLAIAGTTLAGVVPLPVAAGHCQRIMTGAVMPPGLDTVVPQEFVTLEDGSVVIPPGAVQAGANRRLAGEDLALGQVALGAGRLLRPADLGLLASLGQARVTVRRRLRVAILATGDELCPVGEPLPPGCVYDSNRHTIWAMLERLGVCEVIDLGVVRDEPAALREAFARAARQADVVLSSGGVSVGEADHTKAVMAELGEVLFWKIAMRPGRPLAIGRIASAEGQALLFGLPGNPVAVMVSFYAFVREALLAMAGATAADPMPLLRAATTAALRKKPGRTEFQRGIVRRGPDGGWQVEITGNQGSGVLSSMSRANGLLVLGHEQGDLPAGTLVDVIPFDGLI